MTVADTGNAEAAGDEVAVTGYRGPVLGSGPPQFPASVRLSRTGDAVANNGGTAISGYVHTLTVQQAPREPASWPHQVGVIPSPARSFQHRAEAARLRAAVEGGGTAVLSQVLTGMGGVGKTQLAADYARTAWNEDGLDVLVWVTASAQSPVVSGYAQAGVELCRADPDDPELAAKQFLAWLVPKPGQRPCRWLIVLDDVTDPSDLIVHPDDPGNRYSLWPPASPHGRVLLTTRRRDAALFGDGRRRIEVGLFTPAESAAYLTEALDAQGRTEPADQLAALADDLGHLPLALAQAAAYLIDSGETAVTYRNLLADRATKLTDLAPDSLPDEQATALAAAWSLSIERADALRPAGLARPMLHLAAMLDANGIPQPVLTGETARAHLAAHRTAGGPASELAPVSPSDAVRALRALDRLSLIDHQADTPHQTVRIHQLIQRATRDTHTPHQNDQAARTAADALVAAWPEIERDTDLAQTLRANAAALTGHAEDVLYEFDGVHAVLVRAGASLGETGQVAAAVEYFQRIAGVAHGRLGPDHPHTLAVRGELVRWRGEAGDAAGAAEASAELLEHMERVLGNEHVFTFSIRSNVARFRGEAGDAAGAADSLTGLLADQVRVLGDEHPHTFAVRGELVRWRWKAGDAAGAMAASAELLEHVERVLGNEHVATLNTRGNIACFRGEAGDADGAVAAFAELLTDQVRVLGGDHPDTLTTRHNLACFRGEAGDADGAAAAFAELLTDRVRVLGDDHPSTLTTRGNIAYWRGKAGDADGAAAAFAELLTDRVRVLGDHHPDTIATRRFVARWRGRAGDAAGAAAAYTELVEHIVRVLGPDHPDTLTARGNIAYWRGQAGDPAGAAAAFAELLTDRVRVLGDDHPSALTTRHNLAWCQGEAGDAAGAAAAFAELLADRVRVLGDDHPDTIATWPCAAYWRGMHLLMNRPIDEQDQ
ncbi:tetratricopeptide repeat protein [Streptomyces sp. NPDC007905]|uniref:tetratricopeptide repeat protein n=1 Tax=Streptomyces sp. NPDC007905 TaxID=3364788 RepID=UPI0036E6861D